MAEVAWPDGGDLGLADQPMDFEAALAGGAQFNPPIEFDTAWNLASARTPPGRPNPMLSPSVVATFEELRVAREIPA
jgi:hypothetical protein